MPTSPSRRRLAFISAVLVLAIGALAASLAGDAIEDEDTTAREPRPGRPNQASNRQNAHEHGSAVVVSRFTARLEAEDSVRQKDAENESYRVPAAGIQAARIATRFVRAYLRYDVGKLDSRVRSEFAETATPAFARELLESPVRVPPHGTRPPVERLVRTGAVRRAYSSESGFSVFVVIAQDGKPQVLGLSVVNHYGRWAVSELGR